MPKENIKFGIAFTKPEWVLILSALKHKVKTAKIIGLETLVTTEKELYDYIAYQLKKMS